MEGERGNLKAVWNSSKDASSGSSVSTSTPKRFIITFLTCALGLGTLFLLLASSLALCLGTSSSSPVSSALSDLVTHALGVDGRTNYDNGFLKMEINSSVVVIAEVWTDAPSVRSWPTTSRNPGSSTSLGSEWDGGDG